MMRFTHGTTPYDVIEEMLPHKYPMELNKHDMMMLIQTLECAANTFETQEIAEWAEDFRTSILTTINIEEI